MIYPYIIVCSGAYEVKIPNQHTITAYTEKYIYFFLLTGYSYVS